MPNVASRRVASSFQPRSRAEAARRRLLVLGLIVSLAVLTLAGGIIVSRTFLFVHLLVDAMLGVFLYLLWERSSRSRARSSSLLRLDAEQDVTLEPREATGA